MAYRIKVTLKGITPPVWRRLVIPGNITFYKLHRIAEKDTRGRLFDPEYFYIEEVNRRLMHVLEDDESSAIRLFSSRSGLSGTLKFGRYEPCIEAGDKTYTWERIGDLLTWLCDNSYNITIKVTKKRKNDI